MFVRTFICHGLALLSPLVACRRRLPHLAALVVAVSTPQMVSAGDVSPLTEEQFLARLEAWEPRFDALRARVESARAAIVAAKTLPNPTVSYSREEVFPSGQSLPENYLLAELPLDISGRRSRRVRAAEAAAGATIATTQRERILITLDALDLYHDAARARLEVESLIAGRDAVARITDVARSRAAAGEASGYDRERLEVEVDTYGDRLAEAEAQCAIARRILASLIGEPDALFDAADGLGVPAAPVISPEVKENATEGRADYRAARERVEQARIELTVAERAWVPGLSLAGGWKSTDTGSETANGYVAGLGVTLPLFDHGQAERAAARALLQGAQADLRMLKWQIATAIDTAATNLASRVDRARSFDRDQLPRLDRLIRRAEVSYREGEHSLFELLDAHRTYRDVRLRALDLRREAKRAQVQLWRALGRRPEPGETP